MYDLQKFNFSEIMNDNFSIAIFGKTNSGKSTLLYYLLGQFCYLFKSIFFITANIKYSRESELDNYIWKDNVKVVDNSGEIEAFLNILESLVVKTKDRYLVIYDDIGDLLRKGCVFKHVIYSRHLNISQILLLHDLVTIEPKLRKQLTVKIFTSKIQDVKKELEITDPEEINHFRSIIKELFKDELPKKYFIFFNSKAYFFIMPKKDLKNIKERNVNILPYSESEYKKLVTTQVKESIKNMKDSIFYCK
jgi:hypothetical protein